MGMESGQRSESTIQLDSLSSVHEWELMVSTPSTEVSSQIRGSPIISDWSAEFLPDCTNLTWLFVLLCGQFFQWASVYCWSRSRRQHCSQERGGGFAQRVCLGFREWEAKRDCLKSGLVNEFNLYKLLMKSWFLRLQVSEWFAGTRFDLCW